MKKYTVETPWGTFTRQTERNYSHLVLHLINGCVIDTSWAGREDLARKAKPNWYIAPGQHYEKEIFAVSQ